MKHELKFRYIYGIPGQPETYFARYFTIEEVEKSRSMQVDQGDDQELDGYKIISRDQFTGLKDKNGKEIYENDIVNYRGITQEIEWNCDGHFSACSETNPCGTCTSDAWATYAEIIGNTWNIDKPT